MSNNPPEVLVGFTREQVAFLIRNCDANLTTGLVLLDQTNSRSAAAGLIGIIEKLKAIKKALEEGDANSTR